MNKMATKKPVKAKRKPATKKKLRGKKPTSDVLASGILVHCAHDEIVDIETLTEHPRNPNKHPEKQLELLSKIIQMQGWRSCITVSNRSGFIIKGHGRLQAARLLGVDEVPVDRQNYGDEAAEQADMIADNRIAELAEIDNDILGSVLQDLNDLDVNMDLTGFDDDSLNDILGGIDPGDGAGDGNTNDPDKTPEAPKKPMSKKGDIWLLGSHRLMCGDSTKRDCDVICQLWTDYTGKTPIRESDGKKFKGIKIN